MTTDQTWACPICGMSTPGAHGCVGPSTVTPLPATVGQPTPTSSLEEARRALYSRLQGLERHRQVELPQWRISRELGYSAIADAGVHSWEAAVEDAFNSYDCHVKAAARAEVIREVEATFEKYGKPDHGDWCSSIQAWNPRNRICDCGLDDALRVLSQGGEGKA